MSASNYIPESVREAARWTCAGECRWFGDVLRQLWRRDDGVREWRDVPREPAGATP